MTEITQRQWAWVAGELPERLSPLARELLLTEAEGYVVLKYHPKLVHEGKVLMPAGLYFARTQKPADPDTPKLFLFPPPYHVVEVLMANRGWGGTYGDGKFTIEAYGAIGRLRSTPAELAEPEIDKIIRPMRAYSVYRLFTPTTKWHEMSPSVFSELGFCAYLPDLIFKENQP